MQVRRVLRNNGRNKLEMHILLEWTLIILLYSQTFLTSLPLRFQGMITSVVRPRIRFYLQNIYDIIDNWIRFCN